MNNINDLRKDLVSVFEALREGTLQAKEASAMNNTAGKIISTLKVELSYAAQQKKTADIPFMNYRKG